MENIPLIDHCPLKPPLIDHCPLKPPLIDHCPVPRLINRRYPKLCWYQMHFLTVGPFLTYPARYNTFDIKSWPNHWIPISPVLILLNLAHVGVRLASANKISGFELTNIWFPENLCAVSKWLVVFGSNCSASSNLKFGGEKVGIKQDPCWIWWPRWGWWSRTTIVWI